MPGMPDGPLSAYRDHCRAGNLKADPQQALAAEKLQSLFNALKGYRPQAGPEGWRARLGLGRPKAEAPQGLYIFGRVGRGKSMLMDMFFDTVPVAEKRRVHFHAFMLEVHEKLHALRQNGGQEEPVQKVAAGIAQTTWLLCFDEFQVDNIADAMILGRLFEALFEAGVVVVATSNAAPDNLYKDGLQRDRFLPFIDLIRARLDVLELDGAVDYRRDRIRDIEVYHTPLGPDAEAALESAFERLTDGAGGHAQTLTVQGRQVEVPRAAHGVAVFAFAELFERPLGAADYLAIARLFHTVIVKGIPAMTPDRRDVARRFLIFVDTVYEHRVKLVCSADAPPDSLYPDGPGAAMFERAASRLMEMQGRDYIMSEHLT